MDAVKLKTDKTTICKHTLELTGEVLKGLLRDAGHVIPEDAEVTVDVPGGGDWSSTALDMDCDSVIQVKYTTTERSA